ncbi:putative Scopoletin glucosyltransferase [Cocos nucifera]|uniref:Putative Scopoletin glucosyltransferase n=1 Tax=Cocos nucifera TaxID=13894 RepID=A0A8K0NBP2_COCNU|nr:putative Scopoletin glucosyltransferase [Cocos nucifera]
MHYGWNSCLEGVSSGVPMITWLMHTEQFYNEKLMVEELKVGVGLKEFALVDKDRRVMAGEEIGRAIGKMMDGRDEAEGVKRRAREQAEMVSMALEEGGSSMKKLIQELIE